MSTLSHCDTNILLHCRPSRLWVWFHECGEDEDSTGTGDCWKYY